MEVVISLVVDVLSEITLVVSSSVYGRLVVRSEVKIMSVVDMPY